MFTFSVQKVICFFFFSAQSAFAIIGQEPWNKRDPFQLQRIHIKCSLLLRQHIWNLVIKDVRKSALMIGD